MSHPCTHAGLHACAHSTIATKIKEPQNNACNVRKANALLRKTTFNSSLPHNHGIAKLKNHVNPNTSGCVRNIMVWARSISQSSNPMPCSTAALVHLDLAANSSIVVLNFSILSSNSFFLASVLPISSSQCAFSATSATAPSQILQSCHSRSPRSAVTLHSAQLAQCLTCGLALWNL